MEREDTPRDYNHKNMLDEFELDSPVKRIIT